MTLPRLERPLCAASQSIRPRAAKASFFDREFEQQDRQEMGFAARRRNCAFSAADRTHHYGWYAIARWQFAAAFYLASCRWRRIWGPA